MKSKEVGLRIKKLIKENNLKQSDVAEKIGLAQSVISDVITGRRDYDKLVNILSENYGWSRDYIITGETTKRDDLGTNKDIIENGLSKEDKMNLVHNLEKLYSKHQQLLSDASKVMKEIVAINKLLVFGTKSFTI